MASNEGPANNAGNEAGANRLPAVPPTSPASDSRVTNGRPDNAPTTSSSESDINTNSEPTSASHRPLLPGFLNVQDEHQDMTIDLQTGVATYQPLTGRDRHRDPLCDLPHLVDRQDIESQRILYAFLLLAGPGDWGNTVQLYNYLFHRTSDVVTHDGQLVTPAPPIPAMATEASIKAMLEQQDLYPIDKEGLFEYMDKLTALNKPFIGQGRQQGMRYELDEVIDMLRDWIEEAGVLIVRNPGVVQGGTR
jgi:hypothetical protein